MVRSSSRARCRVVNFSLRLATTSSSTSGGVRPTIWSCISARRWSNSSTDSATARNGQVPERATVAAVTALMRSTVSCEVTALSHIAVVAMSLLPMVSPGSVERRGVQVWTHRVRDGCPWLDRGLRQRVRDHGCAVGSLSAVRRTRARHCCRVEPVGLDVRLVDRGPVDRPRDLVPVVGAQVATAIEARGLVALGGLGEGEAHTDAFSLAFWIAARASSTACSTPSCSSSMESHSNVGYAHTSCSSTRSRTRISTLYRMSAPGELLVAGRDGLLGSDDLLLRGGDVGVRVVA